MRVSLILAGVLLTTGCASTPGSPAVTSDPLDTPSTLSGAESARPDVMLTFDDLPPALSMQQAINDGTADIKIDEVSFTGAMLALDVDREGGQAVRFPSVGAPPGVVTMVSRNVSDVLNPELSDFTFGADVRLDRKVTAMERRGLAGEDDGNNVLQRGVYFDPAQYKLQVDDGHASCLLRGSAGQAIISIDVRVPPNRWTRLRCLRADGLVTITQDVLEGRRAGESKTASAPAPVGEITMGRDQGPAAIGGKVNGSGEPVREDSDQFNGSIDNVFYDRVPSAR